VVHRDRTGGAINQSFIQWDTSIPLVIQNHIRCAVACVIGRIKQIDESLGCERSSFLPTTIETSKFYLAGAHWMEDAKTRDRDFMI
jgi:hypothetical protein